jgi:hypothetical protein
MTRDCDTLKLLQDFAGDELRQKISLRSKCSRKKYTEQKKLCNVLQKTKQYTAEFPVLVDLFPRCENL